MRTDADNGKLGTLLGRVGLSTAQLGKKEPFLDAN
jgi:hypothetical protein